MQSPSWTPERPFQALALTGGGYRGLFTARALQVIEEHIKEPVGRRFDLICGTSIGGIIALAAAFEVPMAKVVETFEAEGERIFPPRDPPANALGKAIDLWRHANKPRYSADVLRKVITKIFPSEATLNDALHPVAIPAVNVTQGRPQVFKTRHVANWTRDWKYKAIDIAAATSAAPTYFELAEVERQLYVDGGLFANAPDLIAIHEAEHFFAVRAEAIRLLSIGTTTRNYSLSYTSGRQLGIADWMTDDRLFSVTISSQQQFVDNIVSHRLGDNYFRLDYEPSQEQSSDLGLDRATDAARRTLIALADKRVSDVLASTLAPFLSHSPQLTIVRHDG